MSITLLAFCYPVACDVYNFFYIDKCTHMHLLCNAAVRLEQLSSVLENDMSDWLAYVWRHKG